MPRYRLALERHLLTGTYRKPGIRTSLQGFKPGRKSTGEQEVVRIKEDQIVPPAPGDSSVAGNRRTGIVLPQDCGSWVGRSHRRDRHWRAVVNQDDLIVRASLGRDRLQGLMEQLGLRRRAEIAGQDDGDERLVAFKGRWGH
jgi:hypothetical protein